MKIAFFDAHSFEKEVFERENHAFGHELNYFDFNLTSQTADLARGHEAVCCFVNDKLDLMALTRLKASGVRLVALRSAGFNHVDLMAANRLHLSVVRVPEYSPHAVAEHAVALILTLNRKIHRAHMRVRELNFSLEGLVGFDMVGKTVGVIGTGRIGAVFAKIMRGFGCRVLAHDLKTDPVLERDEQVQYVPLRRLFLEADVVSLHVPLTVKTRHMIDAEAIQSMKHNALIINTGRGALIETPALIEALKAHRIAGAGLDVYEEEEGIFFRDFSAQGITDDTLARLLTFPNVVITSHQAFLTHEALGEIARTTLMSIADFEAGRRLKNQLRADSSPMPP